MSKNKVILALVVLIFSVVFSVSVFGDSIDDNLHLNIQLYNASGSIETGTWEFQFNISSSSDCTTVALTNTTNLTTNPAGVISYYLPAPLDYSTQYWLCMYRNGTLKSNGKIARTPATFDAQNISASGIKDDSHLSIPSYNVTAQTFLGNLNWSYLQNVPKLGNSSAEIQTVYYPTLSTYWNLSSGYTVLATYTNLSNVYTLLNTYANSSDVTDIDTVYTLLQTYANTTDVYDLLTTYSNTSDIYTLLSTYANSSDVPADTLWVINTSDLENQSAVLGINYTTLSSKYIDEGTKIGNSSAEIQAIYYPTLVTYWNLSDGYTELNTYWNLSDGYLELSTYMNETDVYTLLSTYANSSDTVTQASLYTLLQTYMNESNVSDMLSTYANTSDLIPDTLWTINTTDLENQSATLGINYTTLDGKYITKGTKIGNSSAEIQTVYYPTLTTYINETDVYSILTTYWNLSDGYLELSTYINLSDVYTLLNTYANSTDVVLEGDENETIIAYQNISNIPTCGGTDKLTFDGSTLSCDTDQTGASSSKWETDGEDYFYNDSTDIFFNESHMNLTVDEKTYSLLSTYWNLSDGYTELSTYMNETDIYALLGTYMNLSNTSALLSTYANQSWVTGFGYNTDDFWNVSSSGNTQGAIFNTVDNHTENSNNIIFAIIGNGTTGTDMPHFWIQNGGASQASGVSRSFMIVNEVVDQQNTVNITSCVGYMDYAGETLQIDCNTTGTGADLLVGDDMQVVGDVWVKDGEGEWHYMTRTLTELDKLYNDILFNQINTSLSGGTLTIDTYLGDNITYNLDGVETRTAVITDTVSLTSGTNASPEDRYVYYDSSDLQDAASDGGDDTAKVVHYLLGAGDNLYALKNRVSHTYEFIDHVYARFEKEGALYISGFNPTVQTDDIEVAPGTYMLLLDEYTTGALINVSQHEYFVVENSGTYVQSTSFNDIDEYADGTAIGANKYFNVVFGLVPTSFNESRFLAVAQTVPPTGEYNSVTDAESDSDQVTNLFPTTTILKETFVPIARVVMQRTGGVNTIQTLTSGLLWIDVRGNTAASGGSASSPSITDHGALDGLLDDDHTQYVLHTEQNTILQTYWNLSDGYTELGTYMNETDVYTLLGTYMNLSNTSALLSTYANTSDLIPDTLWVINTTDLENQSATLGINYTTLSSKYAEYTLLNTYINETDVYALLTTYSNTSDIYILLSTYANSTDVVLEGDENETIIAYQNISNIPTCGGTDKLTFDGSTLSCDTDQTGASSSKHETDDEDYFYNDSTDIFFNESHMNLTIDEKTYPLLSTYWNLSDGYTELSTYMNETDVYTLLGTYMNLSNTSALLSTYANTTDLIPDTLWVINTTDLENQSATLGINYTTLNRLYVAPTTLSTYANETTLATYWNLSDGYTELSTYWNLSDGYIELSTYMNLSNVSLMLSTYANSSDTVTLASLYTTLGTYMNLSNTSALLSTYANTTDLIPDTLWVINTTDLENQSAVLGINYTTLSNKYAEYTLLSTYANTSSVYTLLTTYTNETYVNELLKTYSNETDVYDLLTTYWNISDAYIELGTYMNESNVSLMLDTYINETNVYALLSGYVNATGGVFSGEVNFSTLIGVGAGIFSIDDEDTNITVSTSDKMEVYVGGFKTMEIGGVGTPNVTILNTSVVCNSAQTTCWKTYVDAQGNLITEQA